MEHQNLKFKTHVHFQLKWLIITIYPNEADGVVGATPHAEVVMELLNLSSVYKIKLMTFNARTHYNVLKCIFISIHAGVEAINCIP